MWNFNLSWLNIWANLLYTCSQKLRRYLKVETLLTIIFVLVDDWYRQKRIHLLKGKPAFGHSEVITLFLAMDYFPFPAETQCLDFIPENYLPLFPQTPDLKTANLRHRSCWTSNRCQLLVISGAKRRVILPAALIMVSVLAVQWSISAINW